MGKPSDAHFRAARGISHALPDQALSGRTAPVDKVDLERAGVAFADGGNFEEHGHARQGDLYSVDTCEEASALHWADA